MKKNSIMVMGCAFFLVVALPLHAQGGCVDSPENSTVVLALVGSAGAFVAAARARMKARRSAK